MTPTQTLTLIAEEIEAGAEALYEEIFVGTGLAWGTRADPVKTIWRQRSAAVLVAAGAVRKEAVPETEKSPTLTFVYTNWRGETAERRVSPLSVEFGSTEWHPEPQALLRAVDMDKGEIRLLAMRDIQWPCAAAQEPTP